ncbi:MAG: preprotein translocase subunit SecA [Coriobacteriia bacterium]|nr:preprotein translocase subunit SecA [Coriobacteriia bacterium]
MGFLSKILTIGEGKQMKAYQEMASYIGTLEPDMQKLSDAKLKALTKKFKERLDNGEDLNAILPEAFAAVREASVRTTGLRHFDVQLIGGMALNDGQIAEMKTGEGKTLVSTLAGYLNALSGDNVHIVTVNDYLAERDSIWMGQIYKKLGLTVGLIQNGMMPQAKVPAYKADITYGTNSEFGFDYLRDNMVTNADGRVQRGHSFCIVDEVDSILIDEARTPLIISGAGTQAADTYKLFARAMPGLHEGEDFEMDEAKHTIFTTEVGLAKVEASTGIDDIFSDPSGQLANHLQQALRAQFLFHKDVQYVVVHGEVKIVDEFTGRIMEGRRYSEGLHQAIEAKENVQIREENQTLATITLQNYFRLYDKLSGMTGTAMTEDSEFRQIYKLPVVAIPPNKPVIRDDKNDLVYQNINAKFNAVADDIEARHNNNQPCLVGTVSIESSERLSTLLRKRGIKHEILNAKYHASEAEIIAQAGRAGAVTIATNMAGRGTDILLGGNPEGMANVFLREEGFDPDRLSPEEEEERRREQEALGIVTVDSDEEEDDERPPAPTKEDRKAAYKKAKAITDKENKLVLEAGGLCVIGTERHESRRIDNQLRGRSGRQGDPGVTQFYLSLEDDLMRLFGGPRMDSIKNMMANNDIPEDTPIQAGLVSKAIESAQRQVESINFGSRKHVLEYDDVMNLQRSAIYNERNDILDGKDLGERVSEMLEDAVERAVTLHCPDNESPEDWDFKSLNLWIHNFCGRTDFDIEKIDHDEDPEIIAESVLAYLQACYDEKCEELSEPVVKVLQPQIMLRILDTRWMAHLQDMDYLKQGIGLRAYGQLDPLVEYKQEAYAAFKNLTESMYEDFLQTFMRLQMAAPIKEERSALSGNLDYSNPEEALNTKTKAPANVPKAPPKEEIKAKTIVKDKDDPWQNVGRNDPCPCGSGKKYKKCHGRNN